MKPYRKSRTTVGELGGKPVVAVDANQLAAVTGGATYHCIKFDSGGERSKMCIVDTECYWE